MNERQTVSCDGGNDVITFATAFGGTKPYSYSWNNGQTTDTAYNLAASDYIVTVIDASGCIAKDTATIAEPVVITGTDTQIACDSLTWIDGVTYTASNNTAIHTLTAANGCDSVVTLDLTINNSIVGFDYNGTTEFCATTGVVKILSMKYLNLLVNEFR